MEPRREEQKTLEPGAAQKPKRFRIVKLEERIAPQMGGNGTNNCIYTQKNNCPVYTDKHCDTLYCSGWCSY